MKLKLSLISLFLIVWSCSAFAASTATNCDSDTKLMLHLNGSDASTTFTDSSCSLNTVSPGGQSQLDTAQKKFGTASVLFDGTDDYISTADNANYEIGSGDFTIDFWVRYNLVTNHSFIVHGTTSGNDLAYQFYWLNAATTSTTDQLRWMWSTDGTSVGRTILSQVWLPVANTWYHVAVVRSGTTLKMFIDGTQLGSNQTMNQTVFDSSNIIAIGSDIDQDTNGWLDEFRFVKGTAVWTSNFTSPIAEYTVSSCGTTTSSSKASGIGVGGMLAIY